MSLVFLHVIACSVSRAKEKPLHDLFNYTQLIPDDEEIMHLNTRNVAAQRANIWVEIFLKVFV